MKRLLLLCFIASVLVSCNKSSGHLTGVLGRPVYQPDLPLGMVYIHAGSYQMGDSDEDVPFMQVTNTKTVSIPAFYMDQTEISNNEYRQFVYWVRDSIAREKIYAGLSEDEEADDWINAQDTYFDGVDMVEYEADARDVNREYFSLNWDRKLEYDDEELIPLLADMYYPQPERFYKRKEIDTRKLNFRYFWIDWVEAARKGTVNIARNGYDNQGTLIVDDHRTLDTPRGQFSEEVPGQDLDLGVFNKKGQNTAIRGHVDRSRFIIDEVINVYPDTLCWIRDFTYAFNDPMANNYFWHPAYDNYPVVGVTWSQAKAFSVWRTQLLNNWLVAMGDLYMNDFRLPSDAEWERAARGDLNGSPYPWGGPYIRNDLGCFLGNFKPMRGRYFDDGGIYTVKVNSYHANDFGLYCMAGNVAEWCETTYDEKLNDVTHDLATEARTGALDWGSKASKRKVIRGGSWKDIGFYLRVSTRTYEFQDTAKSYIGFRNVMSHLGRGDKDFAKEGGDEVQNDIILR